MLAGFVQKLQPVRGLPVWARYSITTLIVLACFGVRYAVGTLDDRDNLPLFLMFIPAVFAASFIFDRGSGYFALLLSAFIGVYFFIEPEESFTFSNIGEIIRLITFILVGLLCASIIEALRKTLDQLQAALGRSKAAEEAARSSRDLLSTIMESTPDMIFVKDLEGRYVHVNSAVTRLFHASREQVIGRRDRDMLPADMAEKFEADDREVLTTGRMLNVEEDLTSTQKVLRTYMTTKVPWFDADRNIVGVIGIARDIHDRKLIEQRLSGANEHKQVLLDDIHHRVKNHLQLVASLLNGAKTNVSDPQASAALDAAARQVYVLARVYDRLKLAEGSTAVNVCEFIDALCNDLRASSPGLVSLSADCSAREQSLESSQAVMLGLAVNELVANAAKYAFESADEGEIDVTLRDDDSELVLEVKDNGCGISAEAVPGRGQRLVRGFAKQLRGSVEWISDAGTRVILRFPNTRTSNS